MDKKDKLIIIIAILTLIISISSLIIYINIDNADMQTGYTVKCIDGSIEHFNESTLLVCKSPNPLNYNNQNKYNITIK